MRIKVHPDLKRMAILTCGRCTIREQEHGQASAAKPNGWRKNYGFFFWSFPAVDNIGRDIVADG